MGDCEEDLVLDYKLPSPPPPPQAKEEEEKKKKKREEIQSSPSSSHASDHATDIETLVGDLQNLCLNNNNNNNLDAADQDPVISTIGTLEEGGGGGGELQNHHPIIIISSEEGSGETLEEGGELQNLVTTSEGVETGMINQLSINLVRFFKKEKNDNPPVDHATTTTTTTTASAIEKTTTLDDKGELQNLSSEEEGKETQRDHKPDADGIKTLTLTLDDDDDDDDDDGDGEEEEEELQHNLSSPPQKDNDHPTTNMEETLDVELHNPEVEINPSCYSEWDKLHNPQQQQQQQQVETDLIIISSEWDDGWKKDNPETNLSYSEWDGTTREKDNNNPQLEVMTIFKEEEEEVEVEEEEKRRIFQYPLRPEEPDCVFYLRTGSCRYGFHCKFNHPPRKKHQMKASSSSSSHLPDSSVQRVEPIPAIEVVKEKEREREDYTEWKGKIECKYYRTPGGCKFGKACKYYHPQQKKFVGPPAEFNFLGLPIRPGEKKCPFFMRTGSCKFATSCRFHHPDPTDAVEEESDPLSGYHDAEYVELHSEGSPQPHVTSWSLPGTYNEAAPYMDTSSSYPTEMVSTSQAHYNREWNGYQVPDRYSPERNRNPQSASLMNHSTKKANNSMHQQQQQMVVDEFPERPGQYECQYYMKHGDCKYRSACRFHHPKNYSTNSPALSSIGLPLRPDQIICSNYSRFGICKYGPSCKYDHPA